MKKWLEYNNRPNWLEYNNRPNWIAKNDQLSSVDLILLDAYKREGHHYHRDRRDIIDIIFISSFALLTFSMLGLLTHMM